MIFLGVIILIGVFALVFVIGAYNALVTLRNRYKNAYSQIDVQLKRRYDLIPNLVETAKGYMAHERGTLEAVIAARNQAVGGLQRAAANPGVHQKKPEAGGRHRAAVPHARGNETVGILDRAGATGGCDRPKSRSGSAGTASSA